MMAKKDMARKSDVKKNVEDYENFRNLAQVLSNTKETLNNALEDLDSLINGEYNGSLIEGIPRGYDFDIRAVRTTLKVSVLATLDNVINNLSSSMHYGLPDDVDDANYEASAKKSKRSDIHKRLAKLGGFTKEDEDSEDDDDSDVEIEVEVEGDDDDDVEVSTPKDEIEEACKGEKAVKGMRTNKKVRKEQLDYDADDFKEDNQAGTGNAGSELPEDADENQEINEKGSGNAGSELPEDADEQENIKESTRKMRLERMKARNKSAKKSVPPVRKFSVTNGGSPDQTSYNGRYNQNPMVRNAIDGKSNVEKFDEVGMLQARLDALNKSKRNERNNNVPQRLR